MSFRNSPPRGSRSSRNNSGEGFPAWMIFLVGVAIVFGVFYLWQGAQNFIRTGGLGVEEATRRALMGATATPQIFATRPPTRGVTQLAPATAVPDCTEFQVIVPNAIVRSQPNSASSVVRGLSQGMSVCVLSRDEGSEWYTVDGDPDTRRRELAYMHQSVIVAVNPTPTPSNTPTPLPTVTIAPITDTPTPEPTDTPNPDISPTARPSRTPLPTPIPTETQIPLQNA